MMFNLYNHIGQAVKYHAIAKVRSFNMAVVTQHNKAAP
jgi:hypothetical protein